MTPDATIRQPAVAGRFYPAQAETLRRDLQSYLKNGPPQRAIGCVIPHAGYMYSGHVAGAVYARLQLPRRFVILCPNHTGRGAPLAINASGAWRTPLGDAPIDGELARRLMAAFPYLEEDAAAHQSEHALEVQLPFLQALVPGFTFVPICVGVGQLAVLQALGKAIAAALREAKDEALIVASSDMNHYETDAITRVKDEKAIARVLALDAAGLHEVVRRERISMCGYGPTVTMLTAAKELGATTAELVKYATSGDVSGDREMVVGYAGMLVR